MQTTHKIPGASATRYSHYLTSVSQRGDYYIEEKGEQVPNRWHGSPDVLNSLGLSGEEPVKREDLRAVMSGLSPLTGSPLRPAGSDGTRVAGVELMMAPPKTVSALWATSGPYRRAQVEAAHRRAVASALRRTEREVALVRRRGGDVVRFEPARSLFAAEFTHTTSRLAEDQGAGVPDPQLHSHLVVFAAERTDGKLAAVESRQLYRTARENGAWYRAELAKSLRELGLEIERRTGRNQRYFEVQGIPQDLASRWSTRSEDVDRAARVFRQRYGREPRAGELGSLTTQTRGSKSAGEIDVDRAWRAVGEEHGLDAERSKGLFDSRSTSPKRKVDLHAELLTGVTSERSMIDSRELRAKAYELAAGVCRPEAADRAIEELERSGELVRLADGMWTTRRLREMERATLKATERRATGCLAPVEGASLKQARREITREIHSPLSAEQREALETITGPGGTTVLVGQAGTGKGVVLSTAARAWQLEGHRVIGTAVAGATAQRLGEEAQLDASYTLDGLVGGVERGTIEFGRRSVVICDEAGMADTERLSRLTEVVERSNAKLVLAGDAAQLSPIGAGGLFGQLEGRVPTAELTEVHRARHDWERRAWEQARAGQPAAALAGYAAHERLHVHDTRAQAAEAMVSGWDEARRKMPGGRAVMITDASNKERDQINAMAQERRAAAGELGDNRVALPSKPYGLAAGDEVVFQAQLQVPNQRRVENGIRGTVVETSRHSDRLTIATQERDPREVEVNTAEFSDLSLGYAVHVHKGQGITTEASGILMGGWQTDRESAYVALSRAREETHVYVSREDLGEAGMDAGAIERLAERMRRSGAQEASIGKESRERPTERAAERSPPIKRAEELDHDLERGFGIE